MRNGKQLLNLDKMNKIPHINFGEKINLDIGCGSKVEKDHYGIDIRDCEQDIVWDVTKGLPFPDNSIHSIRTSHFLEHLSVDEEIDFLKEVLRVLKVKGKMFNRLPHSDARSAFYPGHKSYWNEQKVTAFTRSGLAKFVILKNEKKGDELFFAIQKL